MISSLKTENTALEKQSGFKSEQISLLQNSIAILESQYNAEKKKKPKANILIWILATIAAFGTGFIAGNL